MEAVRTKNGIPVFSFVAFSGTGKTTLLEKLIAELKSRGLRVAAVKHDAHDFDIDREGKDSWRFSKAGAEVTVIASGTKAAVIENRYVTPEKIIDGISDVDIIVAEGYKTQEWPKIAIERRAAGKQLPVPAGDCLAIITDEPNRQGLEGLTCFELNGVGALADFIIGHCR